MTGYGPWSLWSGLNDATRNQENYTGLEASDFGIGGIGGMTNVNARASQMRKGFRVSVSNGNQMYRFRAMVSYGSGTVGQRLVVRLLGGNPPGLATAMWTAFTTTPYSYFASAEKLFGQNHRLCVDAAGFAFGARRAAGFDRRGLRPVRQTTTTTPMWVTRPASSATRACATPTSRS